MKATSDPAFEFIKRFARELDKEEFNLPPIPDTALRVQEALSDPNVTIEKLSRIVLSEPAFTARLLRIANSAMMHRGTLEIIDIRTAISRIGFDMVRNVAVSLAVSEAFNAPQGSALSQHLNSVRRHSVKVCALAFILARNVKNCGKPEEAMLAGLLHAIGKFYILTRANDFPALFSDAEALEELLNTWHTGVGRAIVDSWDFPEQIVNAVDEYEQIDRNKPGNADFTDIIIVANLLAQADEKQITKWPELDNVPSLLRMKIDSKALLQLVQESDEEIRSMTQALAN